MIIIDIHHYTYIIYNNYVHNTHKHCRKYWINIFQLNGLIIWKNLNFNQNITESWLISYTYTHIQQYFLYAYLDVLDNVYS